MRLCHSAIIFVNSDLTANVQAAIQRQLEISEAISAAEFDARVIADPNYPTVVHLNDLRVLVIRSFFDYTNRGLADIVLFVKAGLAYIECSKIGPPKQTFQVDRMRMEKLFAHNHDGYDYEYCGCHNDHIQSNILYPMYDHCPRRLYPFGSDPIRERHDDDDDFGKHG